MIFITDIHNLKLDNTIVTIGKFDCLHRGHQLLFDVAGNIRKDGMQHVILTFDTSPADAVKGRETRRIISNSERHEAFLNCGADVFVEYPFTEALRNMSPEGFARDVLREQLGARFVVCGDDFRFGKDRAGDSGVLTALGNVYGFGTRVVERIRYDGEIICSTLIRSELQKGNLDRVNDMLGRPYSIFSEVEKGFHIGTDIGVPTINLHIPEDKLLPPNGVYATRTIIDGKSYISVTNVGLRPTFHNEDKITVETNILDFEGDIYGRVVTVLFYQFIREEKKFSNASELVKMISKDIQFTRDFF